MNDQDDTDKYISDEDPWHRDDRIYGKKKSYWTIICPKLKTGWCKTSVFKTQLDVYCCGCVERLAVVACYEPVLEL